MTLNSTNIHTYMYIYLWNGATRCGVRNGTIQMTRYVRIFCRSSAIAYIWLIYPFQWIDLRVAFQLASSNWYFGPIITLIHIYIYIQVQTHLEVVQFIHWIIGIHWKYTHTFTSIVHFVSFYNIEWLKLECICTCHKISTKLGHNYR